MNPMKFKSKVDWWGWILVAFFMILPCVALYANLTMGESLLGLVLTFGLIDGLLILPIYFGTNYTFTDDFLHIRCGLVVNKKIPYENIILFRESRMATSSAALSLDRIEITYSKNTHKRSILISPERKQEFLSQLETRTEISQRANHEQSSRTLKILYSLSLLGTAIVLILVVVGLFSGSVTVELGDKGIYADSDFISGMKVPYEEISSLALRTDLDIGSRRFGVGSAKLMAGKFKNQEFGKYNLYSYTHTDVYVVVYYTGGVMVFNSETTEATEAVYQALKEAWEVSAASQGSLK